MTTRRQVSSFGSVCAADTLTVLANFYHGADKIFELTGSRDTAGNTQFSVTNTFAMGERYYKFDFNSTLQRGVVCFTLRHGEDRRPPI